MDSTGVPLSATPGVPSLGVTGPPEGTEAAIKRASAVSAAEHQPQNTSPTVLARLANTIMELFMPGTVRQGWRWLYDSLLHFPTFSSLEYRYYILGLAILFAVLEYEQPGYLPRPNELLRALIGFPCAIALILGVIALEDYVVTKRWPWKEEGWVWPWEAWLWGSTVYDLGTSTSTVVDGYVSPNYMALSHKTETPRQISINSSQLPTKTMSQPMFIPPTPQLPPGLQPIERPHSTPAQNHRSGLLGESPMPPSLGDLDGDEFQTRVQEMKNIPDMLLAKPVVWSYNVTKKGVFGTESDKWGPKKIHQD